AMLKAHGDWMELGSADEQKPAKEGTGEAWGRSLDNAIGGWYGLKKGVRGRVGMYIPPLLEALGLAEVEHKPNANRMRAICMSQHQPSPIANSIFPNVRSGVIFWRNGGS